MKIAIDSGHRKDTAGKRYKDLIEWEFNDYVAKRLDKHLKHNGFDTLITITTETHPYPESTEAGRSKNLQYRANRANDWKADLFVSIHANAHGDTAANGYDIFIYKKGGSAERLANLTFDRARQYLPLKMRRINEANFAVLRRTNMPAILVEHGFYTNDNDRALLHRTDFRELCAIHLAAGVCDYYSKPFKNYLEVNMYKDIDKISAWAKSAVETANKAGIMVGDTQGYFNPQRPVTREELAVVVAKLIERGK